ncbi:phage Gp37/Gp68 family protein, partial [Pseudodesulfovibrio pelocollis]|uniref:phage Gp37/Gp68 family protein n=1 Tax=Pseudodesulfovibrio pelocollis TaxID=3051432 RepID=UPI00255A74E7
TALVESVLATPLRWRKPCRVFVGSMTDLFHESVPDKWLDMLFARMAETTRITYQILTKRPQRMREYLDSIGRRASVMLARHEIYLPDYLKGTTTDVEDGTPWPLPNVWLGVTVEDQLRADERIPLLLDTPAAVRYVSYEPGLGAVDLDRIQTEGGTYHALSGSVGVEGRGQAPYRKLDWVICGGESGPGARPMHPEWARGLRDQCQEAGVPFFFKQWGEWGDLPSRLMAEKCVAVTLDGQTYSPDAAAFNGESLPYGAAIRCRVGKKAAGRLLDGREWNEFPGVRV